MNKTIILAILASIVTTGIILFGYSYYQNKKAEDLLIQEAEQKQSVQEEYDRLLSKMQEDYKGYGMIISFGSQLNDLWSQYASKIIGSDNYYSEVYDNASEIVNENTFVYKFEECKNFKADFDTLVVGMRKEVEWHKKEIKTTGIDKYKDAYFKSQTEFMACLNVVQEYQEKQAKEFENFTRENEGLFSK